MGIFFGTDGLRGIANEDLSFELAYKCGNALTSVKKNPRVIIGRDTRVSGEYFTLAVAGGVMSGGGSVVDLGVIPTGGVAYLVRELGADFGVVISASHNPKEYNGIKIFGSDGYKLSDNEEESVERYFIRTRISEFSEIGRFRYEPQHTEKYAGFLASVCPSSLSGLKVVIDGANGAAHRIAPELFSSLGASVTAVECEGDGKKINEGCGALYPERISSLVVGCGADIGFAFDGDADRLMIADSSGRIIDGDMIIYMLAKYMKAQGKLKQDTVVGTSHTNMAIEDALKREGISFIRTDVGDKYVLMKLTELGLSLGGEQSGHIILKDIHSTGDGILTAIAVACMLKDTGKAIGELFDIELYPQTNVNLKVNDKLAVMNSALVSSSLEAVRRKLGERGRVMLRASGTEPKIRIMVESGDRELSEAYARELADAVVAADAGV